MHNVQSALDAARRWCSRREQSVAAVREKLAAWDLDPSEKEEIIAVLIREKVLDDARYLRSFIHDHWRFNHWGRQKIMFMLQQQGFSRDEVNRAWEDVDEAAYTAMVREELKKKLKSCTKDAPYELKARLLRYGAARGFGMQEMMPLIDNLLNASEDDTQE